MDLSALANIKSTILSLITEYGTAVLGHLTGAAITAREKVKTAVKQAETLAESGKIQEALDVIKANWAGLGEEDEEILAEDLLMIRSKAIKLVTVAQQKSLCSFLARLPENTRRRIRLGHVQQPDQEKRLVKLAELAKLRTAAEKRACLQATGYLDETEAEKVMDKLRAFERYFHRLTRRLRRENRRLRNEITTNAGAPGRFDFLLPWRWRFLNLLR